MNSAPPPLALRSRRVVTPDGIRDAVVVASGGRIERVCAPRELSAALVPEDLGRLVLMPGLVDSHVHINEPGRTEWEGFATATRAAAAGGVTTLADMPLNCSPVTIRAEALEEKRAAARGKCYVDVGFHGGLVPSNVGMLGQLQDAGVLGIKAFLCPSGIDDFPPTSEPSLRRAMEDLADRNVPLLVHAELVDRASSLPNPRSYSDYLAARPDAFERKAVELLARLARETGCWVHVVHISSAEALDALTRARQDGAPLTVETCPHYLDFEAESIDDGRTLFKCAPPIRKHENRELLWRALLQGSIDLIASDHSPCPPSLKKLDSGSFETAWGGISSLGLSLSIVWTEARQRGVAIPRLVEWMSTAPARLLGLEARKGRIAPGYDADLVAWDPEATSTIREDALHFRHRQTPYAGRTLHGVVRRTFLGGRTVFHDGKLLGEPAGQLLERGGGSKACAD